MDDPIGYFLTWNTYGTWLPGDARGWVEYRRGWHLPDTARELEAKARMTEDACRLSAEQRNVVQRQIAETCQHRGWRLHAVNCRSNHVHVVVSACDTPPKKIRADLKAWATRCLKQHARSLAYASGCDANRENWWVERGSIRFLYSEPSLEAAIVYVTECQDIPR
jgi:REP element-mobilizing transposase RayT